MKQIQTLITILFITLTLIANAQKKYVKGSGKMITKKYTIEAFDKLNVGNFNGKVHIEIGKPFSIQVIVDDNLDSLINIEKQNGNQLCINMKMSKNYNWIENATIEVKITMPEIATLSNSSNSTINLVNVRGKHLTIANSGNGNIILQGSTIDKLDIENSGNGDVNSNQIMAAQINIVKRGNGNIKIKTNNNFNVSFAGNGNIINYGSGKAIIENQSGNGDIIYKN